MAARFSGDVDTVEALFTSGIISMAADACRILSIMAVIAVKNTGLALILLLVVPLFAVFTRHVQKRMLSAQFDNRRAVAAVSGLVPETLHNIRTIPRARSGGLHGAPVCPAHRRELCRRRADKFLRRRLFAGRARF